MKSFELSAVLASRAAQAKPYLEFLRDKSMSAGLYVLPSGGFDEQWPHAEDEVYVVLAGRSLFTAADETRPVKPGDTIFVPAGVAHNFHAIGEELRLIVAFSPPEGSRTAR